MAGVVAAAGALAGGLAGKALQGSPAPPAGGIPGLTTTKQGSKGAGPSVVQVDPTIPLQYFAEATQTYTQDAMAGLQYYQGAVSQAIQSIQTGTAQANQTLQPLSTASNEALNTELQMMGLQPIQATANSAAQLGTIDQSQLQGLSPAQQQQIQGLQSQMNAAQSISDPDQRAATLAQINQAISGVTSGALATDQSTLATDQPLYQQAQQQYQYAQNQLSSIRDQSWAYERSGNGQSAPDQSALEAQYQALSDQSQAQINQYGPAISAAQASQTTNQNAAGILNSFGQNYDQLYGQGYLAPYTGQQVADAVTSLPGYQFQFQQGQNALMAQQAATGMLNSGNSMAAATNYGQNQALQYYNTYMSELNNTVNQGAGATASIASNLNSQGQNIASLQNQLGIAGNNTYTGIGTEAANNLDLSGQVFNQDALANMAAQNQQSANAQAQATQAAVAGAIAGQKAQSSAQQGAGAAAGSSL